MQSQPSLTRYLESGVLYRYCYQVRCALVRQAWGWLAGAGEPLKRALDVVVAALLLVLLSPVLLCVALVVKCADGGPVLFWQDRIGRNATVFRFPKFRSMVHNAERLQEALLASNEHADGITFKLRRDPRITRVGRWLRRTSIDELPQLWCVLKGEMSLVGPRPCLGRELAQYSLKQRRRLECLPGLTCYWQVQGRAEIGFARQVELDVQYLETHTLRQDLLLLLQTVPAVLGGRGAY